MIFLGTSLYQDKEVRKRKKKDAPPAPAGKTSFIPNKERNLKPLLNAEGFLILTPPLGVLGLLTSLGSIQLSPTLWVPDVLEQF